MAEVNHIGKDKVRSVTAICPSVTRDADDVVLTDLFILPKARAAVRQAMAVSLDS
jgi:hypothetical protein